MGDLMGCADCTARLKEQDAAKERVRASEWVAGLRLLADFIEVHPALAPDFPLDENVYTHTTEEFEHALRELMSGGKVDKEHSGAALRVGRLFGPHRLAVYANREQVCERRQVGVRTVEKPDPEAVKHIKVITVEEPVYEWDCKPILIAEREADLRALRDAG
jgi:hypothetical protein